VLNFAVNASVTIITFAAAEEIAWRGYLLPRLLQLGRNRALAITGLVHAVWHLPLILLTSLYHSDGNLLIIPPLFVATIVAAVVVYGDLSDRNRKHLAGFDRARRAQRLVGCPGSADCHEFTGAGQRVSRGRHRCVNSAGHRRGRVLAAKVASATSAQGVVKSMKSVGQQWEPS
jgi:hypothetical protein